LLRGRKGSINAHCSSVRLLGYLAPSILPKIGKMSGFHTRSKALHNYAVVAGRQGLPKDDNSSRIKKQLQSVQS